MTDPKDPSSSEWRGTGKELDASGKIVGDDGKPAQAPRPSAFAPPKVKDEKLELDTSRMPRGPNEWADPAPYRDDVPDKKKRTAFIAFGAVLGLAIAVVAAFVFVPSLQRQLPFKLPTRAAQPMLIMSEPSGADVRINGSSIGKTPYAGENRYVGRVKLEIALEGYEPFKDAFQGGTDVHVAATLRKK